MIENHLIVTQVSSAFLFDVMTTFSFFSDWVLKLGPETFGEGNLYEYSVVSDPGLVTLFVLVRDPKVCQLRTVLTVKKQKGLNGP